MNAVKFVAAPFCDRIKPLQAVVGALAQRVECFYYCVAYLLKARVWHNELFKHVVARAALFQKALSVACGILCLCGHVVVTVAGTAVG